MKDVFVGLYGIIFIFLNVMNYIFWCYVVFFFLNLSLDVDKCGKKELFCVIEENVVFIIFGNLKLIKNLIGIFFFEVIFVGGVVKGKLWL